MSLKDPNPVSKTSDKRIAIVIANPARSTCALSAPRIAPGQTTDRRAAHVDLGRIV
jgi:hypothetical protein